MSLEAQIKAAEHAQQIAMQIGGAQMAVDVFGWAIKYAHSIPTPALKELMDMVTGEPK